MCEPNNRCSLGNESDRYRKTHHRRAYPIFSSSPLGVSSNGLTGLSIEYVNLPSLFYWISFFALALPGVGAIIALYSFREAISCICTQPVVWSSIHRPLAPVFPSLAFYIVGVLFYTSHFLGEYRNMLHSHVRLT